MKRTNKGYIIPVILIVLLLILSGFIYFSKPQTSINLKNDEVIDTATSSLQDNQNNGEIDVQDELSTTTLDEFDDISTTTEDISTTTQDII